MIPTQEKLDYVENLIRAERQETGERHSSAILRDIARDLRARLEGAPSAALSVIEQRIVATERKSGGPRAGAMIVVAQEVIARWPTLKQALEKFGAEVEA